MNKDAKIFVAGAAGMVGSAIIRNLLAKGYTNIVGSYHSRELEEQTHMPVSLVQMDLTNQALVSEFFRKESPEYLFLAAARVGGIHANNTYPAQFIHDNLIIQSNMIHAAWEYGIKRLLFLGSSCIYPGNCPQPMKEEYLLTGPLEPTNEPYAIAKIAGIKMCESYNREYGTRFFAVMPTNIYGPNDNFDLETSHVLPALIRKFHEAKQSGAHRVKVWGTGTPRREFLHVDDMADGSVFVMNLSDDTIDTYFTHYPSPCFVNLGTGEDCTIKELSLAIKAETEFTGKIVFDPQKPDGTQYKRLDTSRLDALGWRSKISLDKGIQQTYGWFRLNQASYSPQLPTG